MRVRARSESALACIRCGYDLAGMDASGRCPECAAPVSDTLADIAKRVERRAAIDPAWLRMMRTAFVTSCVTLLALGWYGPGIAGHLGMRVVRGNVFNDWLGIAGASTALLGIVLCFVYAGRDALHKTLLVLMIIVAMILLMPALGST